MLVFRNDKKNNTITASCLLEQNIGSLLIPAASDGTRVVVIVPEC